MSNQLWQKIDEVFPLVADLPRHEREIRLREICGDDEILRREILALLAADEKAADFFEVPAILPNSLSNAFTVAQKTGPVTHSLAGEKIGAYRVIRKIGSGGMGAVYLAIRDDGEFHKKAAIKLIRRGSDTDFNLRQFRRERQALAALEHPNIARLLDGGTTKDGLPFFVMEYVEGETFFNYCNSQSLDLTMRLQLFRQICAAVAYAHQKQIIHRDLKPANIIVTAGGTPKLLDFGIAKILDPDLIDDPAAQTETLMRQMTPEYASPEQIKGEKVTPATDIYSLGVILYELVFGERPYKFPSRAPHDIARVICEEKIRIPNFKLQIPNAEDLSFILQKSLQKKSSGRFASVDALDAAIERFLAGLPVLTEISQGEFFEETASDSGGPAISLAVVPFQVLPAGDTKSNNSSGDFLGIGLADALTTKLSVVRQLAVRPTSWVLRAATGSHDTRTLGEQLDADYVLEGHILRLGEQVRVSAQLLKTKDASILWAGQFDEAGADIFRLQDSISERVAASLVPRLTTEEQEILRRHGTTSGAAYESYLRGRVSAYTYTFEGIAASEKYFQEAIAHDANFALAYSGLADFYTWQSVAGLVLPADSFPAAKAAAQRAIELDPHSAEAYTSLAFVKWAFDWDFAESQRLFRKSIALNPNNPKTHEWFSYLLGSTGRHTEAIAEMQHAEQLDPRSPTTVTMYGFCLYNARRYNDGYEKTRRALELDPDYYLALQGLGWVGPPLGKIGEAVAGCRRAVEISDELSLNKVSLAIALIAAGQIDEAREIAVELEERRRRGYVPAYHLALVRTELGENDMAFRWLDEALEERGYWTLWMRVDPRFDRLREDPRFAERLARIKPLTDEKATGKFVSPPTGKIQTSGNYKKSAIAAIFVIVCTGLIWTANFKNMFFKNLAATAEPVPFGVVQDEPANEKSLSSDPVANDLYQSGKQQLATRTKDGINKAVEFFNEAVRRDPNFALAFSGLAETQILIAGQHGASPVESYRKAEEYAVKALAIDPDLAEARVSLGMAKFKNTRDFSQAEKHFLRAIELDPKLATAHYWYANVLMESDRDPDALREIQIAAELDPRSAIIASGLAGLLMRAKRFDEAIAAFDKAIENDNTYIEAYYWKSLVEQFQGKYDTALDTYRKARIYSSKDETEPLWMLMQAEAYAAAGHREEALKVLNNFFQGDDYRRGPSGYAAEIALVYHLLGDNENAFAWLGKIKFKDAKIARFLIEDPRFAKLHSDPQFTALAQRWQVKK